MLSISDKGAVTERIYHSSLMKAFNIMIPSSHSNRSFVTTLSPTSAKDSKWSGEEFFQKAILFQELGSDSNALECAKLAEAKGVSGSMYTLAKVYQIKGMMDHARIRFGIAVSDYKHREAAVEMIKMLYDDLIADHNQIQKLSENVRAVREEDEITDNTKQQDIKNMLTIGELHLKNISWRSDKTDEAKALLDSIRVLAHDHNPPIDLMQYPNMASLARLNPSQLIFPD